jgi:hypothetical protein
MGQMVARKCLLRERSKLGDQEVTPRTIVANSGLDAPISRDCNVILPP